jgi:hypothetical protein
MKIRTILLAAAFAAGACKSQDAGQRASKAADNLNDKTADMQKTSRENAEDVTHASADLARAATDFGIKRDQAVLDYRNELRIYQAQSAIARSMLGDATLTAEDHAKAADAVIAFDRECNLAEQSVDALATATSQQWDAARDSVSNQMRQVRDAHDDAFSALSATRHVTGTKVEPASPRAEYR